ncbi:MAG: DUF3419 family protein [Nanoarchaeota archaeon]
MVFEISNESLYAVVAGMAVEKSDDILAVAGSGDQAFALLEGANHVFSVDVNLEQIALMEERVAALTEGAYERFIWKPEPCLEKIGGLKRARNQYFSVEGRLERIARKLERLAIMGPADITESALELPRGYFNKVYLSNVMGSPSNGRSASRARTDFLASIASTLPSGGLIYSAVDTLALPKKVLVIDNDLTHEARRLEREYNPFGHDMCWTPTVYRKE